MKRLLSIILTAIMLLSLVPMSMFSVSAETLTDSQGVKYSLSYDETYYRVSDYTGTAIEVIIPAEYNGKPVKEIGQYAFFDCSNLTNVEIPDSVENLYQSAFNGCSSLKTVEIPDSVTSIGESAFSDCTSLTSVSIPDSLKSIYRYAFNNCSSLESIEVSSGNTVYKSVNNCLIQIETKALIAACNNSVIPSDGSVASIGDYAFSGRNNLTNIVIPDSVTSIGNYAFYGSSLTNIKMPDSITFIGQAAFAECDKLTSLEIPASAEICEIAFADCDNLKDIYFEADKPAWAAEGWDYRCNATMHWGCKMTVLGNIDDDGDVDASDYILIKRAVLKTYELSEQQKLVADIDADSDVDATDYVLVKRIVLGTYTAE